MVSSLYSAGVFLWYSLLLHFLLGVGGGCLYSAVAGSVLLADTEYLQIAMASPREDDKFMLASSSINMQIVPPIQPILHVSLLQTRTKTAHMDDFVIEEEAWATT